MNIVKIEKILIISIIIIVLSIFIGDKLYNSYKSYEFNNFKNNNKNQIEMIDSLSYQIQSTVEDADILENKNLENNKTINSLISDIKNIKTLNRSKSSRTPVRTPASVEDDDSEDIIVSSKIEKYEEPEHNKIIINDTIYNTILIIDTLKIEDEKLIKKILKKYG